MLNADVIFISDTLMKCVTPIIQELGRVLFVYCPLRNQGSLIQALSEDYGSVTCEYGDWSFRIPGKVTSEVKVTPFHVTWEDGEESVCVHLKSTEQVGKEVMKAASSEAQRVIGLYNEEIKKIIAQAKELAVEFGLSQEETEEFLDYVYS